jgi:hypothetical protein
LNLNLVTPAFGIAAFGLVSFLGNFPPKYDSILSPPPPNPTSGLDSMLHETDGTASPNWSSNSWRDGKPVIEPHLDGNDTFRWGMLKPVPPPPPSFEDENSSFSPVKIMFIILVPFHTIRSCILLFSFDIFFSFRCVEVVFSGKC